MIATTTPLSRRKVMQVGAAATGLTLPSVRRASQISADEFLAKIDAKRDELLRP